MKLTKDDYINIYSKYNYILDTLYYCNGALYLKDFYKYSKKSRAQTCKDVIELANLGIIKSDIIQGSKIISLKRKTYRNLYDTDNKKVSRDESKLKENKLKACVYHNFDISKNEEIKKYLYENFFDLKSINNMFKEKYKSIFDIFDNDMLKFHYMNENRYKVVITTYKLDTEATKDILKILESIYHLFYMIDLDKTFKCEITLVTAFKLSEQNKKHLLNKVLRHKPKINYVSKQRTFRPIFAKNFHKKIIFKSTQELELSTSKV